MSPSCAHCLFHYFFRIVLWQTHRLNELHALCEIAHKGECTDALGQTRDLAEAHHEAVLLAELVQRAALALVLLNELHLVLSGDETLQQLQEIQTQGFLVVAVGTLCDQMTELTLETNSLCQAFYFHG